MSALTYTGNVQIVITATGNGANCSETYSLANATSPSNGAVAIDLQNGGNNFNVPTGATGFLIVPPAGNAVSISVATTFGQNLPVNPGLAFWYSFPAGTTSIIVTTGMAINGCRFQWT